MTDQEVINQLKQYTQLLVARDNLREEIRLLELELATDVSAATAKYSDEPRGGTPELYTVEAAADKHAKLIDRIQRKKVTLERLSVTIEKLDRSLNALTYDERTFIKAHYIDGKSWVQVSLSEHISSDWARKVARNGIKKLAGMLSGEIPIQLCICV